MSLNARGREMGFGGGHQNMERYTRPVSDDAQRKAILRRRAAFMATSLAALGCGSSEVTGSDPAPQPVPLQASASPAVASPSVTQSSPPPPPPAPPSAAPTVAMVCLSIRIMHNVRFDSGSLVPAAKSFDVMREAAEVLAENPKIRVMLEGHRDSTEKDYSQRIGLRRARAVKKFLVAEGIDPARVCTEGFGDARPLTLGATDAERATHRRVDFRILEADETCDD